ncbi:MAG: D-tyrosyl-tRNA(Tyr) deacylase [Dehalococcoidales bacterium]|jgi:D-tyrosyl-tRNA(Tyr) deacylase|nr:D-tyrosyl-tRNA(Tyr) deacylase [Dehalococcoidales bacterium]
MKALLQRVTRASVRVGGEVVGEIARGLVVLVGIAVKDTEEDARYLAQKVVTLRIFADGGGKFNLSAMDVAGELLLISQFTLMADTRRGRRPSFIEAAPPAQAAELFQYFVEQMRATGLKIATGRFQEYMQVEIHNDGPVTVLLDRQEEKPENWPFRLPPLPPMVRNWKNPTPEDLKAQVDWDREWGADQTKMLEWLWEQRCKSGLPD